MVAKDNGLDTLLELDGEMFMLDGGCWVKFEVRLVDSNEHIPHGVRYSLTLVYWVMTMRMQLSLSERNTVQNEKHGIIPIVVPR